MNRTKDLAEIILTVLAITGIMAMILGVVAVQIYCLMHPASG